MSEQLTEAGLQRRLMLAKYFAPEACAWVERFAKGTGCQRVYCVALLVDPDDGLGARARDLLVAGGVLFAADAPDPRMDRVNVTAMEIGALAILAPLCDVDALLAFVEADGSWRPSHMPIVVVSGGDIGVFHVPFALPAPVIGDA